MDKKREIQRKKRIRRERLRKRNMRFFIFLSSILIIVFIFFFIDFFKQEKLINKYMEDNLNKTEEIKALKEEVNSLKEDLEKINQDEFIEKLARKRLGMIKEDELITVDPEGNE